MFPATAEKKKVADYKLNVRYVNYQHKQYDIFYACSSLHVSMAMASRATELITLQFLAWKKEGGGGEGK